MHYYGYPSVADEWIKSDQIRSLTKKAYAVNAKVKVLSSGEWYNAKVLAVRNGLHYVNFEGWAREWNEWVPAERIRERQRMH